MNPSAYTLRIDCPDEKGLVHKITGVLYHNELNVIRNDEFVDHTTGHFFMRTEFSGLVEPNRIRNELGGILPAKSSLSLTTSQTKKVVVLATKEHHCLSDLLIRHAFQELPMQIEAVISNHDTLRSLTEKFDVPFHYLPHENKTREAHESEIAACIQSYEPEYVILAKYMRILTPSFILPFSNRIINIHHSFLPAFIGANPYRQAFDRGVKIIGATAHFVNEHLDEGPIIMQDTIRVDHSHTAHEMARAGRDVEKIVLAKALKWVLEDRVFIKNNKTIIFE